MNGNYICYTMRYTLRVMIYSPNGLMRYNNSFAIVDDIPLLSQWIKKSAHNVYGFFGGDGESVLKTLSDSFDELISWAELYDEASFEKKKMIVNCLIKRVEVSRGYKLKVELNIDFEQFMVGIDKVA